MPTPAAPHQLNPYYAVWLAATGGGSNAEYIAWNGAQWRAFGAERGILDHVYHAHETEFRVWLRDRHLDAIGRREIEGHCPRALSRVVLAEAA